MKGDRKLFTLHSWLGLVAGLFILLFFLTGALIVFRQEMALWENPHLLRVHPRGPRLPYHTLYNRIAAGVTDTYLYSFRNLPQTPGETIEMRIYEPSTNRYGLLYADPYTGVVLGKTFTSLYDVLLTIHYQFYLGKAGESIAAVAALALLGLVLTGLLLYRKALLKVLLFRFHGKWTNWRTVSSNLHRIIGVWSLLFNLVLALSGFWMVKNALDVKTHLGQPEEKKGVPPVMTAHLDQLIERTRHAFGGRVTSVSFPRATGDPIQVYALSPASNPLYGDYSSYAEFDARTGRVIRIFKESDLTPPERFEYALYTLHFGQYGGLGIKLLYSFFGLAGAVLSVTGFMLWYRRRHWPKQADRAKQAGHKSRPGKRGVS